MQSRELLAVVVGLLTACGEAGASSGDESPSANSKTVRNVTVSACPGSPDGKARAPEVLVQSLDEAEDAGAEAPRTCIAWERVGERNLRLKLTGVIANCSVDWEPRATFEDGELTVVLFNQSCIFAGCGCPKDVDLTVEGLDLDDDLSLTLKQEEKCPDEGVPPDPHSTALAIGEAESGETCFELR